jgi:hypothetical protein
LCQSAKQQRALQQDVDEADLFGLEGFRLDEKVVTMPTATPM